MSLNASRASCLQSYQTSWSSKADYSSNRERDDTERPNPDFESCGTAAVRVDRMIFEDPGGAFRMVDLPEREPGESLFELPAADGDGLYPSVSADIGFWPEELGAFGGTLNVFSNAPTSPDLVEVFGRGVDNRCPSAVAATTEFDVPPLDIITLDGSTSSDPGGEVAEYRWTWWSGQTVL